MLDNRPDVTLRRSVLAACVLHDVDATPLDEGVVVRGGGRDVTVGWQDVAHAVRGRGEDEAPLLLARTLRSVAALADASASPVGVDEVAGRARLVALPADHLDHPGPGWVRERVPGGLLELGLGVADLTAPDVVSPLPPSVVAAGVVDAATLVGWWARAREHADRMGELLVARLQAGRPVATGSAAGAVLRPYGGVDVLGLLAVAGVRAHLAREDGTGMRAVAVPDRSRGWLDPSRVDPAFVGAAWTATDVLARGLPVPLLVTTEEVAAARPLGDVVAAALDRPSAWRDRPWGGPRG